MSTQEFRNGNIGDVSTLCECHMQELAVRAGRSRPTFAERFRDRLGETPIAYLTRWRMVLAREKLLQGRDTVARIAISLGYDSEHAFNTAFKRVIGHPPGRYARAEASASCAATFDVPLHLGAKSDHLLLDA